jgi:putative ABC transport system permease protein
MTAARGRWLPLRLAMRDLRGGLTGLRLLAACLFLGVLALAGVGSLSAAIVSGLAERGQQILGGDIQAAMNQREASPEERAALAAEGRVAEITRMRAMAARPDGSESRLVELKGVDGVWPLYGALVMAEGARPRGAEAALAAEVAERLALGVGDQVRIGTAQLRVSGIIGDEPDRIGQGFTLGPTVLVDREGLAATGLVQPGSLYTSIYNVRLPPGREAVAVRDALRERFRDSGIGVRDSSDGAPGVRRFVERLGQFLTLVGLAALAIAGVGVGSGVSSYLDGKRGSLATLKLLGADSRTLFLVYFLQVALIAAAAILVGLAAGALVPAAVTALAGDALPAPPRLSLYPAPLAAAAAYGLLIALAFALVPLGRARTVTAGSLFRAHLEPLGRPGWRILAAAFAAAAAIAALAIWSAAEPGFAGLFLVAAIGLLLLLALVGWLIRKGAALLPRPRNPVFRLALASLHRPGAQTGRLVVALGLGFTLFAALAVVQTNLVRQIETTVPDRAPSFFMLDVPQAEVGRFRALAEAAAPGAELVTIPSMRGSVVEISGRRVSEIEDLPQEAWWLRGDRGLTYLPTLPEGSRIVEGAWWPADYRGPPLVSLDVEAARAVGLAVGDTIVVSILGREITARIASLREINWDTLGFNFVIVFSPGAIDAAPHSFMATIAMDEASEPAFQQMVTRQFPTVSLIRVKEVVETVSTMLEQLSVAVAAAASVAILAGIAVLVGALAASRRARIYDSVVLKMLGATRGRILAAQAIEFGLLAILLCGLALALGAAAGWYVVVGMFELDWTPGWGLILLTLGLGAFATLALGLIGALPALTARPARALRDL